MMLWESFSTHIYIAGVIVLISVVQYRLNALIGECLIPDRVFFLHLLRLEPSACILLLAKG